MFKGSATFLKGRESSFTGTKGDMVNMVYVTVLTEEGDVIELTGTQEIGSSLIQFKNGDKVDIALNLYEGQSQGKSKLKGKIIEMHAA